MRYSRRLIEHQTYAEILHEIDEAEKDRIYCLHGLSHALDVCRIAWILWLEDGNPPLDERKDRIYLAGLLHDIGRARQYRGLQHHTQASMEIARDLLAQIECPAAWIPEIIEAISIHSGRAAEPEELTGLAAYIYRADHLSRNCFACMASDSCKWDESDKNQNIRM